MKTRILFIFCVLWATTGFADGLLLTATEEVLPRYQSLSMDRDFPASDLLLDESTLYIAGKKSVWRWDLNRKSLRRIKLIRDTEPGQLRGLISDGLAIITASDQGVYRIQKNPLKVLKFTHPVAKKGATVGLTGQSDNIFWVHTQAIMHVDRYGRKLIPRYSKTGLKQGDRVTLDSESNVLWLARGSTIQRVELVGSNNEPKTVFDAKNQIMGIQLIGSQLMAHTEKSVLRLDHNGKHLQSIPVTGSRSLATMEVQPDQHAYLFADGLLEVFNMQSQTEHRYRLPLKNAKHAVLNVNDTTATVIDDGILRVFSLSQPMK